MLGFNGTTHPTRPYNDEMFKHLFEAKVKMGAHAKLDHVKY